MNISKTNTIMSGIASACIVYFMAAAVLYPIM